jgi:hypothetical protein
MGTAERAGYLRAPEGGTSQAEKSVAAVFCQQQFTLSRQNVYADCIKVNSAHRPEYLGCGIAWSTSALRRFFRCCLGIVPGAVVANNLWTRAYGRNSSHVHAMVRYSRGASRCAAPRVCIRRLTK